MIKQLKQWLLIRPGLRQYLIHCYIFLRYLHRTVYCLIIKKHEVCFSTTDMYSKRRFYYKTEKRGTDYEPVVTDIMEMSAGRIKIFLDIGAHIGFFSCIAGKILPGTQIHCFEIDKKCIPIIEKNVKLNKLTNVHIHATGLSDKTGTAWIPKLKTPDPGLMPVTEKGKQENTTCLEVEVTTADNFAAAQKLEPDFIKVDVEGAEAQVIKGMKQILRNPGLQLLIEIHTQKLERLGTHFSNVLTPLFANGFMVFEIMGHRLQNWQMRTLSATSQLKNNTMIYAVRKAYIPQGLSTHL